MQKIGLHIQALSEARPEVGRGRSGLPGPGPGGPGQGLGQGARDRALVECGWKRCQSQCGVGWPGTLHQARAFEAVPPQWIWTTTYFPKRLFACADSRCLFW